MINKKKLITILILVVLITGLAVGVYLVQTKQIFKSRAAGGPASSAVISFEPSAQNIDATTDSGNPKRLDVTLYVTGEGGNFPKLTGADIIFKLNRGNGSPFFVSGFIPDESFIKKVFYDASGDNVYSYKGINKGDSTPSRSKVRLGVITLESKLNATPGDTDTLSLDGTPLLTAANLDGYLTASTPSASGIYTITPEASPTPTRMPVTGDCTRDYCVNGSDISRWRKEKSGALKTKYCDFSNNGNVDQADYQIIRNHIGDGCPE